uniref:ATP synthase complex subunit 8 n=1 Tax=Periscepsia handlirschi TaxID=2799180 RepID=A0A7T4X9H8_9MUSC|nr:ATP synthase F0 subunit 8 [Periscepsia handlirschi]QQD89766.1 ATP synthase F0 subunit 8 [Periscepsia handlirschi]
MPQMAPISWLTLFILFSIIFMIFCIMNYYFFINLTPKSNLIIKIFKDKAFNWKW